MHKELPKDISIKDGKISSAQGIGGDDRCGVFMIMNIVKDLHCSVLICEDEEDGGKGAGKFCNTKYIKNLGVNYMVELDRRGHYDAVFYNCANKDFEDFVCDATGFKAAFGSFSDISKLAPAAGIAAVNLSCGYYNAHKTDEYVVYEEMMDNIESVKDLINSECKEPFKYIRREYKQTSFFDQYYKGCTEKFVNPYAKKTKKKTTTTFDDEFVTSKKKTPKIHTIDHIELDFMLELEVVIMDEEFGKEEALYASGRTKAECWADLFLNYTNICFDDIIDYSFT